MGVASYPASGGGLSSVVKSMQTGTASSSGTITITAVNTAKAFVYSTSTGSAGTVAASGSINAANGSTSGISTSAMYGNLYAIDTQGNGSSTSNVNQQGTAGGNGPWIPGGITGVNQPVTGTYVQYQYQYYYQRYINISVYNPIIQYDGSISTFGNAMNTNGMNVGLNSTSLTGGTTSGLYAGQYGATLTNSTTITVTGPCSYQVIEYY